MAGCQSLSMLATYGYNNIITRIWNIWSNTKKTIKSVQLQVQSTRQQDNVHTI